MAAETGYGRQAVSTAVTNLKNRGWIIERERGSSTSGKTTVFELVPDAPASPGMSPGGDQRTPTGMSSGGDQPSGVSRLGEVGMSSVGDRVCRLEATPTDPGTDPGSDYYLSDPLRVSVETTASYGRSLAAGEEQSAEPTKGDPWVALYGTPTESDLPSVAPIAVPTGTALVHQPTTESEATAQRGAPIRPIPDPYDDPWIRTPVQVSVYAPAPEDDPWARSWPVDPSTAL